MILFLRRVLTPLSTITPAWIMTERPTHHEQLSYIDGNLFLDTCTSEDFEALRTYAYQRLGFSDFLGTLYEQEAQMWLHSLIESQEPLGFMLTTEKNNAIKKQGTVLGVIDCDIEIDKGVLLETHGHNLRRPDFVVVLHDGDRYAVGGYEVKSTPQYVNRQIHPQNVITDVLAQVPSIEKKIADITQGDDYSIVKGQMLLPRTPRNDEYMLRYQRQNGYDPVVFPYSLRSQQQQIYPYWKKGKNVTLFPTLTTTDFYDDSTRFFGDIFDVDPEHFSQKVYARVTTRVNGYLAMRTRLSKGTDIDIGVPYTVSELFRVAEHASIDYMKHHGIDPLCFEEFLESYRGMSFFEYVSLLAGNIPKD